MNVDFANMPSVQDKYDIIGRIGSGTYGVVYTAKRKSEVEDESEIVAIKIMHMQKEGKYDCLTTISQLREVKLIRELSHPNIIKQYEVLYNYNKKEFAIVFECADYDLQNFIGAYQSKGISIPLDVIRNFMYQIVNAVSYMHSNWVFHRDLKPTNLLICDNETECGVIKVTDFGLARSFQEPLVSFSELERVVVTLWYRAPELLLGCKSYGPAIDMWAIGCIFAKMLNLKDLFCGEEVRSNSEKNPFQSNQCEQIFSILGIPSVYDWPELSVSEHYAKISRWGFDKRMGSSSNLQNCIRCIDSNSDAFDLLSKLLTINPNKRISASDALKHPYFTKNHHLSINALPPKKTRQIVVPSKMNNQINTEIAHNEGNVLTPTIDIGTNAVLYYTPE